MSSESDESLLDLREEIEEWTHRDVKLPRKSTKVQDILSQQRLHRYSQFIELDNLVEVSRFDLPVEFHQEELSKWLNAIPDLNGSSEGEAFCFLQNKKVSIADQTVLTHELAQTIRESRFQDLDPKVLIRALEVRPKFKFVASAAIDVVLYNVIKKLRMIFESNGCSVIQDTPHGLFNWTMEQFYERRNITSTTWMDALERHGKPCLEKQKLRTDLIELAKFMRLILLAATSDECLSDFTKDVMRPLVNAWTYLSYRNTLGRELAVNKDTFRTLFHKTSMIESRMLKKSMSELAPPRFKEEILDMEVYQPIVERYISRYYQAEADDREMRINREHKKIESEIEAAEAEIEEESGVLRATLNVYYTQIDHYKTLINKLTMEHETRFEELENEVNYKKLTMVNLDNQRKYLTEQMERFRHEIDEIKQAEMAEKEKRPSLQKSADGQSLVKVKAANKKAKKEKKGKKEKGKKKNLKNE